MIWIVLAALLLHPVLAEEGDLRLVATGTGDAPVAWHLDGERVAVTHAGDAVTVHAPAGNHDLWAVTAHEGPWEALARPDGPSSGAAYVPGWWARSDGPDGGGTGGWVPWLVGAAGVAVAAWRPKRP